MLQRRDRPEKGSGLDRREGKAARRMICVRADGAEAAVRPHRGGFLSSPEHTGIRRLQEARGHLPEELL